MRLTDGTVVLRPHEPGDAAGVLEMATDPVTVAHTTVPTPYSPADAERWVREQVPAMWRDGTAWSWAVLADDGGRERFAGGVDVRRGPVPDVGYALAPWARGRGLMTRAVRLAVGHAFAQGLPVVHWYAHVGNLASWRVAHACGFRFDGERRLALDQRGVLRDAWSASLVPGEPMTPRTTWWPVPELTGERVRLRARGPEDTARIAEACSDPETRRWLPSLPHPYTEDSAREFTIAHRLDESLGRRITWAVAGRDDDRLLANVSLFRLDSVDAPTGGEIGYWAHPDARGRGVVTEAVRLVVRFALTPLAQGGAGRTHLSIVTSEGNTASRRVAERAGFAFVARMREDGPTGDVTLYQR